ncbi:transposase [Paenibacillus contaminans]|uniref:Transposase zinc-ribbon domain-containing protein n=1 Tax=Paenibacillus contaminans TaxID=450362 RepID=A0A329MNU0_9BACL|nr:transposase [Paenibacillus contaminans]RAV19577.1 hypothetical protein DQG23_19115 [Paenibacillus contaminans]
MEDQPVISFKQYQKHFLTEQSCNEYLFRMKWPEGFQCSKCRHDDYYVITTRKHPLYECKLCGNQTTLIVGTIFEKTRTDITIWFAAIYLAVQEKSLSTAMIANELEISYQTAWAMMRKIRQALASPKCIANAPKLCEE